MRVFLVVRALLFWVYVGAPDFWKLPHDPGSKLLIKGIIYENLVKGLLGCRCGVLTIAYMIRLRSCGSCAIAIMGNAGSPGGPDT